MLQKPSVEYVKEIISEYPEKHYEFEDEFFDKWLMNLYPKNDNLNAVFLKVTLPNTLYSTNIKSAKIRLEIAEFIHSCKDFDKRLEKGNLELVNEIAEKSQELSKKRFYSFASKYCSLHNRDKFPIYGSLVDEKLKEFNNKFNFYNSKISTNFLKDYANLVSVIDTFQKFFKFEEFNYRTIDRFLWTLGKNERSLSSLS